VSKPIFLILTILTTTTFGQTTSHVSEKDSIEIKNIIEGFYSWYAGQIKNHLDEFSPRFVKKSDGMTTLDFTKYRQGLKRNGFTVDFIKRKISSYQECVDNLGKINYETFLKFDGLDQLAEIKCDFDNVREWTMDQDRHDGADLVKIKQINKQKAIATVQFYNLRPDGSKFIWDYKQATVTFLQQDKVWRIDDLKIEGL